MTPYRCAGARRLARASGRCARSGLRHRHRDRADGPTRPSHHVRRVGTGGGGAGSDEPRRPSGRERGLSTFRRLDATRVGRLRSGLCGDGVAVARPRRPGSSVPTATCVPAGCWPSGRGRMSCLSMVIRSSLSCKRPMMRSASLRRVTGCFWGRTRSLTRRRRSARSVGTRWSWCVSSTGRRGTTRTATSRCSRRSRATGSCSPGSINFCAARSSPVGPKIDQDAAPPLERPALHVATRPA
jgi:hypothetical protein